MGPAFRKTLSPDPPGTPRADVLHTQSAVVDEELRQAVSDLRVVSLAGGVPADELFPGPEIEQALASALRAGAARVLQYGWPEGVGHLRAQIAARMAGRGVHVRSEQILITSGAQQALSLLAQLLVPMGAPVAVEIPTYASALQAFDLRKPQYRPVPRSAQGIDLAALEYALGKGGAQVLYLVASGHNPTGGVLGPADRDGVLSCAERHNTWVIDDDAYGDLQFGTPEPPLLALGRHRDRIVHVGSFSKVLAPGLRVGWIAGPHELVAEVTRVKQAQDLETATLTQRILSAWLDAHSLDDHIARSLAVYRARRDAMLDALRRTMPAGVRWEIPAAGFSVFVQVPPPFDAGASLARGLPAGVGFEPAAPYFVTGASSGAVRLSFSNASEADIQLGVERFAGLL